MINADTGVAVGRQGKYVRTTDGGATCSNVMQVQNAICYLMDVIFFNDSVGYMVGGRDSYNWPPSPVNYGLIYASTDGGLSWTLTDSLDRGWLTALHKVNDSVAFCFGWDGRVLKISNPNQYVGAGEPTESVDVSVYPNPVSTMLVVRCSNQEIYSLRIYDCFGRIVRESEFQSTAVVPVEYLPSGIYYWDVISKDKLCSRGKFLKQ